MISDDFQTNNDLQPSMGSGNIIMPACRVKNGSETTIGERNIIEERVSLLGVTMGDDNLVEVGSCLENCTIGNTNRIGVKVFIGEGCKIGNRCSISPLVRLEAGVSIPDNTSVFVIDGQWRSQPCDIDLLVAQKEIYYHTLISMIGP
jgi:UDP-3-O-[3-hydroxymyristoyl] glucosamine N-acyltransferase